MYIEHFSKNKKNDPEDAKVKNFFQEKPKEENLLEEPEEEFIEEHSRDVVAHWKAPEFEMTFRKDQRWYLYLSLVLVAIIGYALYTDSPVMAITFILIGIVGYIYLQKEPQILDFMITPEGILAGREMYRFENIQSFWIFYEPSELKVISLHVSKGFIPYVHIPIHDQDPVELRRSLIRFIPEVKQEHSFIDNFEMLIGI
jgi:hypothetical protein